MFRPYKNYRSLRRYQQIIMTVVRHGFGDLVGRLHLLARLKIKHRGSADRQAEQISRAIRFRRMLEQLGPTFIKLGQILSTRPDLLPADMVAELANLRDRVTPMGWDQIRKALPRQDDQPFESLFAEFETEPMASASIAQVYRARLITGEQVAVKIVRPGTEKIFKDDLIILEHLAHLVDTHIEEARHWDTPAVIDQLRTSIAHELDLVHEGRNAEIFRSNFAGDPKVHVPHIFWEYSQRQVLVMEYVAGRPLAEFFEPDVPVSVRKELARRGADIVLRQVFEHGFFQADPHPGNILVLPGAVLAVLDFGMFGRLDTQAQGVLARVLHAVAEKDVDRLFRAARDLGVLPEAEHLPEMRVAVLDLLEQYYGIPLKQIHIRQLLRDVIQLIGRYRVGIRHDFLFLAKALGTMEATGRKLDPDFDIIAHIEPFVRTLIRRQYAPRRLLRISQRLLEDVTQLATESPEMILDILRQVRAGRGRLEFRHTGLEEAFGKINRLSDKLILGMILSALIIASSLMAHADLGPRFLGYPLIGGVGFLIAGIAGLWMVFDILRSRRP
ncbi:MAG: hypothetical protein JW810_02455 [Sedimentisphaerales bacterium]|nr:hypothetical protein [Sedimentisphaerales bacterium]